MANNSGLIGIVRRFLEAARKREQVPQSDRPVRPDPWMVGKGWANQAARQLKKHRREMENAAKKYGF